MKQFISAARLILTLNCEESTRLASASLDRDLTAVERWAIRLHQVGCQACRRFDRQIRQLRDAMRALSHGSAANDQGLSDDAVHRIEEAIRQASSPD